MRKKERLILAIGQIDEKYIKEAEVNMHAGTVIKVAAALLAVVAIGLFMFLPYAPVTSDLTDYEGSSYYPLIEEIEDYRLGFEQPTYKNNFEAMMAALSSLGDLITFPPMADGDGMGGDNMSGAPEYGADGNGSYVESTDNQVDGVIESDLMKMTDKYIFRLGYRIGTIEVEGGKSYDSHINVLRVYSIDKENSTLVSEFDIPMFNGEFWKVNIDMEMYLSNDGNTVTLLHDYTDENTNRGKVGIISLDVSDVNNISVKGRISIDGSRNTSRMVDGKLLLVSKFYFNRNQLDYNDPATFVPTIDAGDGAKPIEFEDIIYPDDVTNTRYSVVTLIDADDLSLLGGVAALNFYEEVYVSKDNVYISREYTVNLESDGKVLSSNTTDIAVINYSGERLEKKGIITVRGWAEDQYSLDERDGYLRIVTTTLENSYVPYDQGGTLSQWVTNENASLYIFDLSDNSLAYSLEDFAIEGEEATAVRFVGDKVYVCTAVVVNFTDPVYFIDLSDYENITSADTGVIEGYSDHLISFGDGFALGIGREDWQYSKVEVYEQNGAEVDSVDVYKFEGGYSLDYKAYLVNRENWIFGFASEYFFVDNSSSDYYRYAYVILRFNGYELSSTVIDITDNGDGPDCIRAAYVDGYLYITTPTPGGFVVEKIK